MERPLGAVYRQNLHFVVPPLKPPSITNCLSLSFTQSQLIAILVPKLVAMATCLSTAGRYLHLTHDSYGRSQPTTQTASGKVQSFLHKWPQCPYALQWDALFPLKYAPSHRGSGPPSNTWFPGPTQVLSPKGMSIVAAVFAGLTSVTNRPTDHANQSVTLGRIYVRSTAMRPKVCRPSLHAYTLHKQVLHFWTKSRQTCFCKVYKLFGERELTFTFAICYRPSVCLSVVRNVRAPYSGGSNFRQYFYGIWYLGHPLTSTENFTEIVPREPLRRGS